MDIKHKIEELIAQIACKPVGSVDVELSTLFDHEVDYYQLIIELEDIFAIEIDDEQILKAKNISEIINYVESLTVIK